MTRLCTDPATLGLQFARASPQEPARVRILAQVCDYDSGAARLRLVRCANLARAEVIDLDGGVARTPAPAVAVDVSAIAGALGPGHVAVGSVVSVWGLFDGSEVYAVECVEVNGGVLAAGTDVLAELVALRGLGL